MDQSPSEANLFSASEEIPLFRGTIQFVTTFTKSTPCPYSEPTRPSLETHTVLLEDLTTVQSRTQPPIQWEPSLSFG